MSLKRNESSGEDTSNIKQAKLDIVPPVSWQVNNGYQNENVLKKLKDAWSNRKDFAEGINHLQYPLTHHSHRHFNNV